MSVHPASQGRSAWRLVALTAFFALAIAVTTGYLIGRSSGPVATAPSQAAPSFSSSSPPSAREWATFRSARPAYSFTYPSSWEKEKGATSAAPITLSFWRGGGLQRNGTLGTVALTLSEVPSGTTLGAYGRTTQQQLILRGYKVVATHPIIMGRRRGIVIKYWAIKAMIRFVYARFLTIEGGYAYRLTYVRPDVDFDRTYATAAAVAESFRFD